MAPTPTRRRRPARLTRIAVTGMSVAGTLAIVTTLSAAAGSPLDDEGEAGDYVDQEYVDGEYVDGEYVDQEYVDGEYVDGEYLDGSDDTETRSPAAAIRRTVVIEFHRTVYVDENGNPVDPRSLPARAETPSAGPSETIAPTEASAEPAPTKKASSKTTSPTKKKTTTTTKKKTTATTEPAAPAQPQTTSAPETTGAPKTTSAPKTTTKKKTKKKKSAPSCSGSKCG